MVSATSSSSPAHTTSGGGTPSGSSPTIVAAAATPEMLQVRKTREELIQRFYDLSIDSTPAETIEQPHNLTDLGSPGQRPSGPRRPAGRTNVPEPGELTLNSGTSYILVVRWQKL